MEIDADLHLHGLHSGGVSDRMKIPVMDEQSARKGLDLIVTGDILNPEWERHVREHTTASDGLREAEHCHFIAGTEVEDEDRVHHVLLFPDLDAVEQVRDAFSNHSTDIRSEGRPHLRLGGEEIARTVVEHGGLVGPAHAFTPWTSVYKEHDSLQDCYGSMTSELAFLELGLSADSNVADGLSELNGMTFLSNSDAHSPWPHRMGREFNRIEQSDMSFGALKEALQPGGNTGMRLNAGFDPREGKYHCTACQDCHQKYTPEQAQSFDWTCDVCGKSIKQGVKDRAAELADGGEGPDWRPPYQHMVPLAELVREVVGHSSVTTKGVERLYDRFLDAFPSETDILLDEPIDALQEVNPGVARAVRLFREGEYLFVPGGGGQYGELILPRDDEEREAVLERRADEFECRYEKRQQSLGDFG